MREIGFVLSDGPLWMIGAEAERLWGGRKYMELLSVFDTPELLQVRYGPADLRSVHELSLRSKDDRSAVVLLAGRAWRIRSMDWKRHLVDVEPAAEHGRSTSLGSSRPLSFKLCQAMRRVLLDYQTNPSHSRRAAKELASFGTDLVDAEGTILLENKERNRMVDLRRHPRKRRPAPLALFRLAPRLRPPRRHYHRGAISDRSDQVIASGDSRPT